MIEDAEPVFDRSSQDIKTELAVATLVDSRLEITRPMPFEVELKQTEVIVDLKPNHVVFVQSTESTRIPPPSEEPPNLETAAVTWETAPVQFLQRAVAVKTMSTGLVIDQESRQLGRKKTVKSINGTVLVQQESEDQQVRTASVENPVEEALTNSTKRVNKALIDTLLSTDNQETVKASRVVIRVVKDEDKIIIGTDNMQVEDDEVKAELGEINPIKTVAELGKVLDYIKRLTLNIRLNEELGMENNGEQAISKIDVVVFDKILELIEAIVEDYYLTSEPQVKDKEFINRQNVTFSTYGESKKQLVIDARKLSQIQQLLIVLDLNSEPSAQDEEERVLHELDQLGEIESLVEEIESRLKDETSEFTMIVSQDLMTFLEKGGKIIEETESTGDKVKRFIFARRTPSSLTRRMSAGARIHTSEYREHLLAHVNLKTIPRAFSPRKFITISSSDREIKIDLITMKKLMKLLKKKRLIDIVNYFNETQAPEEIKGNIMTFQSVNNISIWFFYQIIIFILALVDDQRPDYKPNQSKVLYVSTKQEIAQTSDILVRDI